MKKHHCGPRFKALLKEVGITPSQFAIFCKVEPQHVNNWYLRGVPYPRLEEIARLLSVNSQWLLNGEGPKHPTCEPAIQTSAACDAQDTREIYQVHVAPLDIELPLYKEVPKTPGARDTEVAEIPGTFVRLPRHYLESLEVEPHQAICVPMIGDSMSEKIEDGSTLAIDRSLTQIVDGQIYALKHDGMLRIKYLHRLPGGALRLRSHNSGGYPDEIFSAEQIEIQNIEILGWVFWWSTLNKQRPPVPFG
ncbi:transcriptional regulator [Pseudomonas sp. FW300-N1A1]|uniref:XRE family transcriptional regulator n=1 Tax=Pseudomonas sp. FW300-N1A1 TaxID=2075555 RepID=UPI000CD2D0BC|nr:helix-turn-helix transcriptional regulator [Pseudomonas sp. FW300-N1A1]POA19503.1 transcriptional regulator [Pseudomonas sp. FW300-N1A1]